MNKKLGHVVSDPEFSEAYRAYFTDYPVERYCHDAHKALADAATALQEAHRLTNDKFTVIMNCLRVLREEIE